MKLYALTQRICLSKYNEKQDCLSHDWGKFMATANLNFIVLPNKTNEALNLVKQLKISGIIITGGDDIGIYPERDDTEINLLNFAKENNMPVAGICRGMQLIHFWLSGTLAKIENHAAKRHNIIFTNGNKREVNSFHNLGLAKNTNSLPPLAHCAEDNSIEAIMANNLLGLMWHPEREKIPHPDDIKLLRQHLKAN